MAPESLARKIQAMLNTAAEGSGATDAERDAFLQKAQELMMRHNLTMSDVSNVVNPEDRKMIREEADTVDYWRQILMNEVARVFFVKCYYVSTRERGKYRMFLVGRKENVQIVRTLDAYIAQQIEGVTAREQNRMKQNPRYATIAVRAYARQYGAILNLPITDDNDLEWDVWCAKLSDDLKVTKGDPALELIMSLTGLTKSFASEIRPFIHRRELAPRVVSNLGIWRRSFLDGAVSRVSTRLTQTYTEQVKEAGTKGTDLVRNEMAHLDDFLEELGLELKKGEAPQRKYNYGAYDDGRKAGQGIDISFNKVGQNARQEVSA